jgi:hypothetical protein
MEGLSGARQNPLIKPDEIYRLFLLKVVEELGQGFFTCQGA